MNRRDFGRSTIATAAGLMIPTWVFSPRKVRHIDLSQFCDPEQWVRYDLATPFLQDNTTYASDGRVAVRTTLLNTPPDDAKEEKRRPMMDSLPWRHDAMRGWRSWDRWKKTDEHNCICPYCTNGRIGPLVTCTKCHGDEFEMEWCEYCDETGKRGAHECPECKGTGWVNYAYEMDGVCIAPGYLNKVSTLGPVEVAIDRKPFGDVTTLVLFRFDGGDGILCPVEKR